jgi:hypothetical protein
MACLLYPGTAAGPQLKFGAVWPIEMKPNTRGVRQLLAGTILRFPTKGAASNKPTDGRLATAACVVLRLPAVSRPALTAARAVERAFPAPALDVDSILVALLRESVARGEYRVDASRVARKLIAADGL